MPKRKRGEEAEPSQQPSNEASKPDSQKTFEIPVEGKKAIQCERQGTLDSKPDLLFTHGAGGGIEAPAMQDFAAGFAKTSSLVMFKGNMNLKSRVSSFGRLIEHEECHPALGGRSMGARAACLAAQGSEGNVDKLVLVSFPLIGAAKQDSREQILLDLPESVHVLFISGTDDTMCDLDHLRKVVSKMEARSWIVEVERADHGMALKSKQKAGTEAIRVKTGEIAADWLKERDEGKRSLSLRWDDDAQEISSDGWN